MFTWRKIKITTIARYTYPAATLPVASRPYIILTRTASSHYPCQMKPVLELSQRLTLRIIPSSCSIHNHGINESWTPTDDVGLPRIRCETAHNKHEFQKFQIDTSGLMSPPSVTGVSWSSADQRSVQIDDPLGCPSRVPLSTCSDSETTLSHWRLSHFELAASFGGQNSLLGPVL